MGEPTTGKIVATQADPAHNTRCSSLRDQTPFSLPRGPLRPEPSPGSWWELQANGPVPCLISTATAGQWPSVALGGQNVRKKRVHPDPPCIWLQPTWRHADVKGNLDHDVAYFYEMRGLWAWRASLDADSCRVTDRLEQRASRTSDVPQARSLTPNSRPRNCCFEDTIASVISVTFPMLQCDELSHTQDGVQGTNTIFVEMNREFLDFWQRFSRSLFDNRPQIASSLDTIRLN